LQNQRWIYNYHEMGVLTHHRGWAQRRLGEIENMMWSGDLPPAIHSFQCDLCR
jgi:hypothetical protein